MTQEISQSFQVEAKPAEVWSFLWDVEAVTRCIPGCEQVTVREPAKSYQAHVRKKVGPFAIGIELDVEVLESQAPALLRVAITGNDRRLRTRLQQDVRVSLRSQGERQTMVEIAGQFTLEGLLASLSRNLIAAHVTQIVDDFAGALRAAILQRQAAADRGSAPAKSESAS